MLVKSENLKDFVIDKFDLATKPYESGFSKKLVKKELVREYGSVENVPRDWQLYNTPYNVLAIHVREDNVEEAIKSINHILKIPEDQISSIAPKELEAILLEHYEDLISEDNPVFENKYVTAEILCGSMDSMSAGAECHDEIIGDIRWVVSHDQEYQDGLDLEDDLTCMFEESNDDNIDQIMSEAVLSLDKTVAIIKVDTDIEDIYP